MKVYFSADITNGKKNAFPHDQEFLIRSVPDAQAQAMEQAEDCSESAENQGKLPLWLRVIQYTAYVCTVLLALGVWRSDVSIEEAYHNAPWIFYILAVSTPVCALLTFWAWLKKRKNDNREETVAAENRLNALYETSYAMLGVPKDAPEVDILVGRYKGKGDEVKILGVHDNVMLNPVMRIFVQDDCLCLANTNDRHEIPLSEITGIRTFKKTIQIMVWNKETHFSADIYKPYKLVANQYGIFVKTSHGLTFRCGGEEWMLLFPCYELPVFQKLTGKVAEKV